MRERPIIFGAHSVRAILAGEKTQTRRIVTGRVALRWLEPGVFSPTFVAEPENGLCPYGYHGDHLWVREGWRLEFSRSREEYFVRYAGDGRFRRSLEGLSSEATDQLCGLCEREQWNAKAIAGCSVGCWRPSIHMPRWASRLTLEVTEVRVQRLQEISEEDARAEGMEFHDGLGVGCSGYRHSRDHGYVYETAAQAFAVGWDKLNGKRGPWESNPWVWAVSFRRVQA